MPDHPAYRDVARSFVLGYCVQVLSALYDAGFVSAPQIREIDPEAENKLYEICFRSLAQFEDRGGFVHAGQRYFAHGLLARTLEDPAEFLAEVTRTELHGGLDDDVLAEAFAIVAEELT